MRCEFNLGGGFMVYATHGLLVAHIGEDLFDGLNGVVVR